LPGKHIAALQVAAVMNVKTALISGADIAGPTLAYWLARAGVQPTLNERAPVLRSGGYVIDFWGLGYDIAECMGLRDDLDRLGYRLREMRIVDDSGARVASLGVGVFRELTAGRFITVRRSDLAALLFAKAAPPTEVMFGDEITGLNQAPDGVAVCFRHATPRRFDIVIGADGLHSQVRKLAFGPQEQFEYSLGYAVAAFETDHYRPRDEDFYILHNEPGSLLARFALRDDRTLFLFVFADAATNAVPQHGVAAQKAVLRKRLTTVGWESSKILPELDRTGDLYFDRVSQIRMSTWSSGRICLVGDAAFCLSLLAGQGAALGMTAAYVLAGELARCHSYREAFVQYEKTLRSFVESKQRAAVKFAGAFAPRTAWGLYFRNRVIDLTAIPGLARLTFGRDIVDTLALPGLRLAFYQPKKRKPSGSESKPSYVAAC
jgi:2-polyprenyl-6-methoxyphenol hydroxylase-like FAD-dependent oxidoreductase